MFQRVKRTKLFVSSSAKIEEMRQRNKQKRGGEETATSTCH